MNSIDELIEKFCPVGVKFKELKEVCKSISAGGDIPTNCRKGQSMPSSEFPYPIYSNGSNSKALYGFSESYTIAEKAVTIAARGTIGFHAVREAKFTPIVRLLTLIPDVDVLVPEFLNFILDITKISESGGSIPQLTVPYVKKLVIPVPPLEVQKEIVKVLETFTELESELESELEARRSQYQHYRRSILNFEEYNTVASKRTQPMNRIDELISSLCFDGVEFRNLGDITRVVRGQRVTKRQLNETDQFPVYSGGVTPMGYFDKFNQTANTVTVVKYGVAGFVNFVECDFWANDVCYCIIPDESIISRFLFFT